MSNGVGAEKIEQIDHYKIIEKLGQGGMGEVYKAYDTKIRRVVAIKRMLTSFAYKKTSVQRFLREIQNVGKLNHPNIVRVFGVGVVEHMPYIVMEYVEGKNISAYFAGKENNFTQKLEVIQKVAYALQHAHDKKIIHRDLKPDNIMIRENGEPVLLDFGLAKTTELDDKSLTKSGQVVGTPQYMAPEQAKGLKREMNFQTDVYGLGAVLYTILTDQAPFDGENLVSVVRAVLHTKLRKPRHIKSSIPKKMELLCLKALEKKKFIDIKR